jgi:hypothetical protein
MAVGHRVKRSNTGLLTLAERWNGRRWTLTNSRNQDASGGSHLAAVSCPATRTCLAVGTAFSSNPVQDGNDSIAEAWSGNTWSRSPAPAPQDAASTSLEQVSCSSSARCMAIGHYYTTADPSGMTTPLGIPMALVWNGAWAIAAAP